LILCIKLSMMKKAIIFLTINLLLANIAFSQPYKGQIDSTLLPNRFLALPTRIDIDVPVNANAWTNEKPGMHVAFGSEDELYFRIEASQIKMNLPHGKQQDGKVKG
jgi:hypothetical protein